MFSAPRWDFRVNNTIYKKKFMEYYIYGLYSTEDNIVRYVGQTKNNIHQRKNEHKCDALTKGFKNHKCNWIRKVYKDGFEIRIRLLEIANEKNWPEKEIWWINHLKNNNLVNELLGGNSGGVGGKLQNYLSYNDAKEFVKVNVKAKSETTYKKEYDERRNEFNGLLPKNPQVVYALRGEWVSWGDYLSTGRVASIKQHSSYIPYKKLKKIVQENKIKSSVEYSKFIEGKGPEYPLKPFKAYVKEWVDWSTFLTNKKREKKFTYEEFCNYVITLPISMNSFIKNYHDMHTAGLLDKRAPYHPNRQYCKGIREIKKDIETIRNNI